MLTLRSTFVLISIHALREEGDVFRDSSTITKKISIHALREEGDPDAVRTVVHGQEISIHALREEGDPMPAVRGCRR